MAFYGDIPSHERNPDPGDKKFPEKARISEIYQKSRRFGENPGIKIPKLRKIPNFGDKNAESQKNLESPGFFDLCDFLLGIFSSFSNPDFYPQHFRIFGILHSGFSRDIGIFGIFRSSQKIRISIPKKSHPETNSDIVVVRSNFKSFFILMGR